MLKIRKGSDDPFAALMTTAEVVKNAKYIQIDTSKIRDLAKLVNRTLNEGIDENNYSLGLTGNFNNDLQLVLIEDTVNFCFWAEKNKEKWKVEWPKGNTVSGGWYSLVAVFRRALAEKIPILDPKYLSELTLTDVKKIFRSASSSEIPLIDKRLTNLRETGNNLLKKYRGKVVNLLEDANFDAVKIVKLVLDNFPSFVDVAIYDYMKIYFLKRAQILANDLSFVSKNGKRLNIKNINKLTAFADYKIPQILRHYGIVKYNKSLAQKVDNYEMIPAGSPEEVEIRSATIQSVDLIKQSIRKYTASQIDNAIWLISQDNTKIEKPYHRTYSTYY